MPGDKTTYGFNARDADALINIIESPARVFSEWQPIRGGTSGASAKIVLADTGIPARSGTTVGSASCTEYTIVGSTLTTNTDALTVKNITAVAIPSGQYLLAVQESITSFWIAQHPGIINLRLSGLNLQYTLDGSTWVTWETATECA